MNQLSIHINDINKLCYNHSVKTLYVFGSVLTNSFNSESDIDFLVEFLPINSKEYADNYYDLKFSLELVLNRKIDLLEKNAIKNPYFLQSIQNNNQIIYGN
ncbi:MAG: nucleotidyltransferase [Chitinophagaceae bacterium BSSC1]|nr:MAG: nucleotidyltransferase [Chitinophagaceae bacterium BSSC1]